MAKTNLEKLKDQYLESKGLKTSSSSYKSYPQSQADRTRAQLLVNKQDDPTKDSRNIIEKALGLPEDQNVVFDVLELLGRPQQALFGGIDSLQKGESFLEGAWQGLTGEKETSGGQLLRNEGIGNDDNGTADLFDPSTWGVDDVLGLALDIFADPADLAIFPAATKAIGAASDAAKAVDKVSDATKASRSLNDVVFGTAKNVAKGAVNKADDIIGGTLKNIDTKNGLKYIGDVLDEASYLNQAEKTTPLYQLYRGAKEEIGNTFNQGRKSVVNTINNLLNKGESFSNQAKEQTAAVAQNAFKGVEDDLKNIQDLIRKNDYGLSDSVKKELLSDDKNTALNAIYKLVAQGEESTAQRAINTARLADKNYINNNISDLLGLNYNSSNFVIPRSEDTESLLQAVSDIIGKNENRYKRAQDIQNQLNLLSNAVGDDRRIYENNLKRMVYGSADKELTRDGLARLLDTLNVETTQTLANYVDNKNIKSVIDNAINSAKENGSKLFSFNKENISDFNKVFSDLIDKGELTGLAPEYYINRGLLSTDDPIIKAYNDLISNNSAIKTLSDAQHDISSTIDDVFARTDFSNWRKDDATRTVKNTIGDIVGMDDKGDVLDDYRAYYHTTVSPDAVALLKNIDPNAAQSLFTNRSLRSMDTTSINEFFKSLDNNDIKSMFPKMSEEQVDQFKEIAKNGFYTENVHDSILDMVENLPTRVSKVATKDEAINLIGLNNINQQLVQYEDIENLKNKLYTADDATKVTIQNELNSKIQQLNKLENDSLIKRVSKVPYGNTGYKVVDVTDIKRSIGDASRNSKSTDYSKFFSSLDKISGDSGKVAVNPILYNMLNLNRNSKGASSAILGMMDRINNLFKKNKLLSPAYNLRNVSGNAFNMYVAGVPSKDIPGLLAQGYTDYSNAMKAIDALNSGTLYDDLSDTLKKSYDKLNQLRDYGFGDVARTANEIAGVENISNTTGRNILTKSADWLSDKNMQLNIIGDNSARLAMMSYAEKHPEYLKRMGFTNAGQAVANALFDPSDLSDFEKNVMRKIIPFYTFTKKNLAYQIRNLADNPKQYKRVGKLLDAMWGDTSEDERADYWETGLAIPLGENEDGTRDVLNLNLPFGDLIDWVENPISSFAASTSPILRAPYELANNVNTFTGRPISDFQGQESEILNNLPFLQDNGIIDQIPSQIDNRYTDYILGNFTGLDRPIQTVSDSANLVSSLANYINGTGSGSDVGNSIKDFLGIFGTNDPQSVLTSKEYEDWNTLQDYLKYLEQEGINLESVTDWEDTNQGRINSNLQAQIDYLMGRKSGNPNYITIGGKIYNRIN